VILTLPICEVLPATPRSRVIRLDLDGQPFEYVAGQAVLVGTHGTSGGRPYSLASAPEDTRRDHRLELLVGVDAEGRAGSHLSLNAGALVDVDGPFGTFTFPPQPSERRHLFIAGGSGIAPLRAMLRHVLAVFQGDVDLGLFYSARTPDEFAYEEEFRALARDGRIELRQTVTRAGDIDWNGVRGRIDRATLSELLHDAATLCFVCGPPTLVEEMPRILEELGVARPRIRIEEWG
jgi:NAD(P)H-flavin reductase